MVLMIVYNTQNYWVSGLCPLSRILNLDKVQKSSNSDSCNTSCCEVWSVHKLSPFENRMPRIMFGPEKKEVMGGRRKFHSEEPHNL
jgi:hypothetical protein